ncbi:hypothetical protein, partial [Faecalibacterium duncaniae]
MIGCNYFTQQNADKCQSGKCQIASGVRRCMISTNVDPVVDALLNYYLRIAERNNINVKLDV